MNHPTSPFRLMAPWDRADPDSRLTALLAHPSVAAIRLQGRALADATACRALCAAIHARSAAADLPPLVVLDAHQGVPDDLCPPEPGHLAFDLAASGEDFEVTLKVLTWARPVAALGVDLVLSPRFDTSAPPLDDPTLAVRLVAAWTEALLAAGLVACAGPCGLQRATSESESLDAWAPFGAAQAHGLESVFLGEAPSAEGLETLRSRADELVVIGPPVGNADQVLACARAGVDLVQLPDGLSAEEIDAILEALTGHPIQTDGENRVDALREDWLL